MTAQITPSSADSNQCNRAAAAELMNNDDSNPGLKRQLTTALRLHPGRMLQPKRRAFRICMWTNRPSISAQRVTQRPTAGPLWSANYD